MVQHIDNIKLAASYLRRSTDRQEQSLETQRHHIKRYAADNGYEVVVEFVDDAVSGTSTRGRDAFQRLMADAQRSNCPFNYLIVYDLSRFGRGTAYEVMAHIHALRQHGVRLLSVMDPLMGNDFDPMVIAQVSTVSHSEVKKTAWKTIDGQLLRVNAGWWMGGTPPFGYDLHYFDSAGKRFMVVRYLKSGKKEILRPDGTTDRVLGQGDTITRSKLDHAKLALSLAERVAIIQRIFRMYVFEDLGFKFIAQTLNEEGLRSPRDGNWSKNTHSHWSRGTIRSILINRHYVGDTVWNKRTQAKFFELKGGKLEDIEGLLESDSKRPPRKVTERDWIIIPDTHEAIIDRTLFEKAQQIMKARAVTRRSTPYRTGRAVKAPYLLTGLFDCECCEHPLTGQRRTKGKRRIDGSPVLTYGYHCSGYLRKGRPICRGGSIQKDALEGAILELIEVRVRAFLSDGGQESVEKMIGRALNEGQRDPKKELGKVEREIDALEGKISRLIDGFLDKVSAENQQLLDRKLTELREELQRLEGRRDQIASACMVQTDAKQTAKEIAATLEDFKDVLAEGTVDEKRAFIGLFVEGGNVNLKEKRARVRIRRFPSPKELDPGNLLSVMVAGARCEHQKTPFPPVDVVEVAFERKGSTLVPVAA
ncbi:MAG: recombinase family protein [Candidatus Krumholzibacteria bacterium]